jgi:PadR family transcriptional regulator PadR
MDDRSSDEKWMAQMRRGSLELCILAILSRGKRYGYDIVQELAGAEGLVIKEGTIYPLLNRLKGEGLVMAEWQPSPQGPARKYYTLTEEGRRRLVAMRAEWQAFAADVERILGGP